MLPTEFHWDTLELQVVGFLFSILVDRVSKGLDFLDIIPYLFLYKTRLPCEIFVSVCWFIHPSIHINYCDLIAFIIFSHIDGINFSILHFNLKMFSQYT